MDGKADDAEHDGHVHAGLQRIRVDDGIGVVIIDVMIMGLVSCIATATGTVLCRRYQNGICGNKFSVKPLSRTWGRFIAFLEECTGTDTGL